MPRAILRARAPAIAVTIRATGPVIVRAVIAPAAAITIVLIVALARRLSLTRLTWATLDRQIVLALIQLLTIYLPLLNLLLLDLLLLLPFGLTLLNLLLLDLLLLLAVNVANLLLLLTLDLPLLVLLLLNLLLLLAISITNLLILLTLDAALLITLLLNLLLILPLLVLQLLRGIGLLALPARTATDLITWRVIPGQSLSTDAYT